MKLLMNVGGHDLVIVDIIFAKFCQKFCAFFLFKRTVVLFIKERTVLFRKSQLYFHNWFVNKLIEIALILLIIDTGN